MNLLFSTAVVINDNAELFSAISLGYTSSNPYGEIAVWDVSRVLSFADAWNGDLSFTEDISAWDVSSATDFYVSSPADKSLTVLLNSMSHQVFIHDLSSVHLKIAAAGTMIYLFGMSAAS